MALPGPGRLTRIIASIAAALVTLTAVAVSAGATKPQLHSATYRDRLGEDTQAPDIRKAVVSHDGRAMTFRMLLANRPDLTPDMGLQIVIDSDRRQATGNQSLVYSLGADYLIQMLGGEARLLRWDRAARTWKSASAQPTWSYGNGSATIRLPASVMKRPPDFLFEVSAASGLIDDGDGTLDITNAHFDFAPDAGRGGWRYRVRLQRQTDRVILLRGCRPQ